MPASEGIIILGSPRSGTTLLRRLIDAHPDICCPGETFLFRGCARFLQDETISAGFNYGILGALEGLGYDRHDVKDRLRRFATDFYEEMAAKAGKKLWAAKTAADSFYMPQIEDLFADHARFICVTRHGLDVVCSMEEFSRDLQTYITELHEYIKLYPRPFEAFARAWADVTGNILDFAARHPERCFVLKYEDLVAAPDEVMDSVMKFLGVKSLPQKTASILSDGKKVDGIGDWKSFKKTKIDDEGLDRWRTQLPPVTIEGLAPIVNPVLTRAGYEPVSGSNDDDARRRQEIARMMMQAKGG